MNEGKDVILKIGNKIINGITSNYDLHDCRYENEFLQENKGHKEFQFTWSNEIELNETEFTMQCYMIKGNTIYFRDKIHRIKYISDKNEINKLKQHGLITGYKNGLILNVIISHEKIC